MSRARVPPPERSQPPASVSNAIPAPAAFWQSFTVFRWSVERAVTQRWYLVGVTYVVLVLGTALLRDLAVGQEFSQNMWIYFRSGDFRYSSLYYVLVSRWREDAFVLGLFLIVALVDRWQRSIPQVFQFLERRCKLTTPQPDKEQAFKRALAAYQHALLHGKAPLLTRAVIISIVVFGTFIALLISFVNGDLLTLDQVAATANPIVVVIQGIGDLVVDVVTPLLFVWLLASFLWVIGATSLSFRRLVLRFSLHRQPAPADDNEGLALLKNFALTLALIALVAVVLLVGYDFWRGFSVWSLGASLLLLLCIVFLARTCFAPVYVLRQSMLKQRQGQRGQ